MDITFTPSQAQLVTLGYTVMTTGVLAKPSRQGGGYVLGPAGAVKVSVGYGQAQDEPARIHALPRETFHVGPLPSWGLRSPLRRTGALFGRLLGLLFSLRRHSILHIASAPTLALPRQG